jgi:riboflavin biosynthesis pyrimidine reductase
LHRLRALVDAVIIGVGTAIADDPQLTVRLVAGPQPARVVIDPQARLAPEARIFAADGARRFLITTQGAYRAPPLHVIVAPIILGSGRTGFILPPIERADQARRVPMRAHRIDDEVLFDCDLSGQRVLIGVAKKST